MVKLSLKSEVHLLKTNLKSQDKDVEELREENFCQSNRYDEVWKAHDALLGETQKLYFRTYSLAQVIQRRASEDGQGVRIAIPRGLDPDPGAGVTTQGGPSIRLGALANGA